VQEEAGTEESLPDGTKRVYYDNEEES